MIATDQCQSRYPADHVRAHAPVTSKLRELPLDELIRSTDQGSQSSIQLGRLAPLGLCGRVVDFAGARIAIVLSLKELSVPTKISISCRSTFFR